MSETNLPSLKYQRGPDVSFPRFRHPADSSHPIEGWPIGKRIVGRMNDDKAAAIFNVVLELQAGSGWPLIGVVVEYDHLIFAELGSEAAEVAIGLRTGRDCDLKPAGDLPTPFPIRARSQLPIVIGSGAFVRQESIRVSELVAADEVTTRRIVLQTTASPSLFILRSPCSNQRNLTSPVSTDTGN